jgi:hypothetical protein
MLAGTEVAHALAYRLVYPEAGVRIRVLAETGHGYMGWAPLFLGIAGALMLAGLSRGLVDGARRRAPRPVPAWAFGLLPLAGFTLQEFLERWLALGGFPWWMVEQPTFRIGLLLQLPFALAAFFAARFLFRVVERVAVALRALATRLTTFTPTRLWYRLAIAAPRTSALASGHAVRGPPLMARASLLCC